MKNQWLSDLCKTALLKRAMIRKSAIAALLGLAL